MRIQQLTVYTLGDSPENHVPTYTYTCTACNDLIEKRQSFSDPPLTTCEQCGGALRKVIHPVGIVFKGSGWYITDSRSASSTSAASSNGPAKAGEAGEKSSTSKESKDSKESSSSSGSKDTTSTSSPSTSTSSATSET